MMKRAVVLAGAAIATLTFAVGSASAAVIPDPYVSTTGTGSVSSSTVLGRSTCTLSNVSVSLAGTPTGAVGTIGGATASGCTGEWTRMRCFLPAISTGIEIVGDAPGSAGGTATIRTMTTLVDTVVGGQCLYAGTLTGRVTNGSNTIVVSGTLRLQSNLGGTFCSATYTMTLSITTTARIVW